MTISSENMNKEKDQDRVFDLFDTFKKYRCSMFHQQQSIYQHLVSCVEGKSVIEAGCGSGVGTAMLSQAASTIVGTDKLKRNLDFALALYPWISFEPWDINKPNPMRANIVVCIECLEHVTHTKEAIKNLISSAEEEVWISVPNGTGKPCPPENPYHVYEYTPSEMIDMIGVYEVIIRDWKTWDGVNPDTKIDPLVYQITV